MTIEVADLLLVLPHPLSDARATIHNAGSTSNCRLCFLRPTKHRATAASIEPEENRLKCCNAAVVLDVLIVSKVETGVPNGGVTVDGEKLHDAPAGNPEQLKETAELKSPTGVTSIEIPARPPASMVRAL